MGAWGGEGAGGVGEGGGEERREKFMRTKKNKKYVKWLGFDSSHNGWINIKDIA